MAARPTAHTHTHTHSSAGAASGSSALHSDDAAYRVRPEDLQRLRREKPWMRDPKFFTKVKISAGAAMKMVSHAVAGVEKGLRSPNGMPIEVMGLLHGHPDIEDPHTIVVTDAFALPVEGTETSVMSDNPEVTQYMIDLSEALEATRSENFMGWYHSHPFDVAAHSNAFLSATDVSTQLSWQLAEDAAGNPWLALVVDPLRCLAKGRPEIGAFRCYPASYSPPKGMAPDGVIWEDERARNARWGESCISYYELSVDYFTSSLGSSLLAILARDFMWTRVLSSTPFLEKEARERLADRVRGVGAKITAAEGSVTAGIPFSRIMGSGDASRARGGGGGGKASELAEAATVSTELATEMCRCHTAQILKSVVFNKGRELAAERAHLQAGAQAAAFAVTAPVGVAIPSGTASV